MFMYKDQYNPVNPEHVVLKEQMDLVSIVSHCPINLECIQLVINYSAFTSMLHFTNFELIHRQHTPDKEYQFKELYA